MRRRKEIGDEVHPERWMVSYADFMTLLFALFVVLFASAYHDKTTVQRVSVAVKSGFEEMGAFSQGNSAPNGASSDISKLGSVLSPEENGGAKASPVPGNAGIDVTELHRKLSVALGKEIAAKEIQLKMTPEGFVISLHELGFFDSGEAQLLPGAAEKIRKIATILTQYGLDMRIEGHSDNVPIHNAKFGSNWDLSTARAMAVAMMLIDEDGFNPQRVSIAGYAQYHPAASNSTKEGRQANRRVDIVVVASFSKHDKNS
jgi:chemotaxis protein MotB